MRLDDLLDLAGRDRPSPMERARARRALARAESVYRQQRAAGVDLTDSVESHPPLTGAGAPAGARGLPGGGALAEAGSLARAELAAIARAAELAKLGTVIWDRQRGALSWSEETSMIIGYPPGTVRPSIRRLLALVHPDDRRAVRHAAEQAWRGQTPADVICRVVRADGSIRFVACFVEVVTDSPADAAPRGLIATCRDVSHEEAERRERNRLARRRATLRAEAPPHPYAESTVDRTPEVAAGQVRAAVGDSRLVLYAQPVRDLVVNSITRHQVLLRVPDHAIGRAEDLMLIDKWVVDAALKLIGQSSQTSHYQISILGGSLTADLLDHVRQAWERYRVAPERLTFAITEAALVGNPAAAREWGDGLRESGCQLAVDGFQAADDLLRSVPIDLVNLRDHSRPGLVQTCRELGIRTGVQGVRDKATVDLLRDQGIDFAQGDPIGESRPLAAIARPPASVDLELSLPPTRAAAI